MEWVLLFSLEWLVLGSPSKPATQEIAPFASEALCKKAAEAIKAELDTPIQGQRVMVFSHLVCFQKKEN
jgi:hypothetical protein